MNGFVKNIQKLTKDNVNFREVLYTAKNCQLVSMSISASEDIGEEVHDLDQFIYIEDGEGLVVIDGKEHQISSGFAILIPQGSRHNIINNSYKSLKLFTLYSPAEHKDGLIHKTKMEAEANEVHFDGKTTE